MRFSKLILFVIVMVAGAGLKAQDIHFSQFYLSPLNLNPAMTGAMDCNIRLVANYRNQWASVIQNPYTTYSVSYDQKVPVGRYDFIGFGATFWNDVAGEVNFSTSTAKGSASYLKRMGGTRKTAHYLVAGVELGFAQRSIDFLLAKWGSQGLNGVYDPNSPSNETSLNSSITFADLGAGLLWYSALRNDNSFYVGGAFHHLNSINVSFQDDLNELYYSRLTFHVGGEINFNGRAGLSPGMIVMSQGPHLQVNSGLSLKFILGSKRDQQAFHIGLWNRVSKQDDGIEGTNSPVLLDALILSTRFDYQTFSIGFSYDVNVSSLAAASNGSAGPEFALVYKICQKINRGPNCFRF